MLFYKNWRSNFVNSTQRILKRILCFISKFIFMKTKSISLTFLLLFVFITAISSLLTIRGEDVRGLFKVKEVHAAENKYYVYTYGCECDGFFIPAGCDGTPVSATCSSPTGTTPCAHGFPCTFIYYSSCNGQSQAPCPPPA